MSKRDKKALKEAASVVDAAASTRRPTKRAATAVGAKSVARSGAKSATKSASTSAASSGSKPAEKPSAKRSSQTAASKTTTQKTAKTMSKTAAKSGQKTSGDAVEINAGKSHPKASKPEAATFATKPAAQPKTKAASKTDGAKQTAKARTKAAGRTPTTSPQADAAKPAAAKRPRNKNSAASATTVAAKPAAPALKQRTKPTKDAARLFDRAEVAQALGLGLNAFRRHLNDPAFPLGAGVMDGRARKWRAADIARARKALTTTAQRPAAKTTAAAQRKSTPRMPVAAALADAPLSGLARRAAARATETRPGDLVRPIGAPWAPLDVSPLSNQMAMISLAQQSVAAFWRELSPLRFAPPQAIAMFTAFTPAPLRPMIAAFDVPRPDTSPATPSVAASDTVTGEKWLPKIDHAREQRRLHDAAPTRI